VPTDPEPRFVVRELHGVTVGDNWAEHDFLILDSWYGYAEVLWVKKHHGPIAALRRRVYEYAALLNDPPACACGCGVVMQAGEFASRWSGRPAKYASPQCIGRSKWRRKVARRGRVS
jgi:hypothetical protein